MNVRLLAERRRALAARIARRTGGAAGAGLVLVLLPSAALFLGLQWVDSHQIVGLPVVAVFGIMILFGAMALTSSLFARLGLASRYEALALPPGSVRAAIALALIVLFAIITIMLFHSLSASHRLRGLSDADKAAILAEPRNQVTAVLPDTQCARQGAATGQSACWEVHVAQSPGRDATDVAKQLLVLIGTLVTSVTSYYFAARTAEPGRDHREQDPGGSQAQAPAAPPAAPAAGPAAALRTPGPGAAAGDPLPAAGPASAMAAAAGDQDELDAPATQAEATPDEALPPSTGGVA